MLDRSRRLRGVARTAQGRLHHGHDHDEDPGAEEVPEEDHGRPRLRLPARPTQRAGHRRHGARFRQPRLQRLGRTAAVHLVQEHDLSPRNSKRLRVCGGSHEPSTRLGQSGGLQHADRPAGGSGGVHSRGAAPAAARQPARLLAHPAGRLPAAARRPPVEAGGPHPIRIRPHGHHRVRPPAGRRRRPPCPPPKSPSFCSARA